MSAQAHLSEIVRLLAEAGGSLSFSVDFGGASSQTEVDEDDELGGEAEILLGAVREKLGAPAEGDLLAWLESRLVQRQVERNELCAIAAQAFRLIGDGLDSQEALIRRMKTLVVTDGEEDYEGQLVRIVLERERVGG